MARVSEVPSCYESASLWNGAMKIPDLGCVNTGGGGTQEGGVAPKVQGSLPQHPGYQTGPIYYISLCHQKEIRHI